MVNLLDINCIIKDITSIIKTMSNTKPITFDRVIRILAIVAVAVILIWLVNLLKNVLLPFCVACLVAYMLEPVVAFNQQWTHTRGRGLAVFLTLLQVSFVVGILCYFCVPSVIEEIHQIEIMLKNTAGRTVDMPFIPAEIHKYVDRYLNPEVIGQLLQDGRLTSLLDKGSSLVGATIDFLMHTLEWLLTFIYIIFIMLDYKRLMHGFRRLVPPRMRKVAYRVGDDIKHNMNRYFRSQALIAACAAVFYCVGFSIVGIPLAIVLGIVVGILYMIPYFQYVTLIPVAAVCFISSMNGDARFWVLFGQCGLVYLVSQCICDYVLTPKIMGKSMGLNPAVILLSLSVWGALLGLIGMIIALPLTTFLLAYYQEFVIARGPAVSGSRTVLRQ